MKLYKIKSRFDSTGYGLMAEDPDKYCYVYSANTGRWHRSKERELDRTFERRAVYEPISAETVSTLLPGVKPADPQVMAKYVKLLEEQPEQWTKSTREVCQDQE